MKLKHRVILKIASVIRSANLAHFYPIKKDERSCPPFKLVFFCGEYGLNYLNASLISVFKHWEKLPEICIVSDGTPIEKIRKGLIKWPKKVDVISWELCAEHFKDNGNIDLYEYACKDLWGKKFVAINYCAQKFPTFYSDTDILWFSYPAIEEKESGNPAIKMCQDVSHCYSNVMLEELGLTKLYQCKPLNAGLIYSNGNFASFQNWKSLCNYLATKPDNRTEQTSFAVLNIFFNPDNFFTISEVLIKIDDEFSLIYTKKLYPKILARHYVHLKSTTFWRDFIYMCFKKSI
jgi:hypothetical protein